MVDLGGAKCACGLLLERFEDFLFFFGEAGRGRCACEGHRGMFVAVVVVVCCLAGGGGCEGSEGVGGGDDSGSGGEEDSTECDGGGHFGFIVESVDGGDVVRCN